jgi:hypothetical protein
VDGEERLHGVSELPEPGKRLDDGLEAGPPPERHDEGEEDERDEAARGSSRREPDDGERQRERAEVQAQEIGEAAGEEVHAPPLFGEPLEISVEVANEHLQQGQGMDRMGQGDGRGEAGAPCALHGGLPAHGHDRGRARGEPQEEGGRGPQPVPPGGTRREHDSHEEGLRHQLDAGGGHRHRDEGGRECYVAPAAVAQAMEGQDHRGGPCRRLEMHVEVQGREQEPPQGIGEGACRGGPEGEPEPPGQEKEGHGREGDVERQDERDAEGVGPQQLEEVHRIRERRREGGRPLVREGVPEAQLEGLQAREGVEPLGQEEEGEVPKVERGPADEAAHEGQEGNPPHERGREERRRGAPAPGGARGHGRDSSPWIHCGQGK